MIDHDLAGGVGTAGMRRRRREAFGEYRLVPRALSKLISLEAVHARRLGVTGVAHAARLLREEIDRDRAPAGMHCLAGWKQGLLRRGGATRR